MKLTGGCLCGAVRYEANGEPFHSTLCHCSMCRRAAGAPVVAWFSIRRTEFAYVAGTPTTYASSDHAVRQFCPRCGSQLAFLYSGAPDELDITTATLDDPALVPPADHTRTATRLPWLRLCDGLPEYPDGRQAP